MHTLITGGTGTIGRRLVNYLLEHNHEITILSRREIRPADMPGEVNFARWDARTEAGWAHLLEEVDTVVNLAGAGVVDSRWTEERKKLIRQSRLDAGQAMVRGFQAVDNPPSVLIQASAVGYYGTAKETTFTEENSPADDFLANVCKVWEASVKPIASLGVRIVYLRTGIVLDPNGGALPQMALPFRFFVGGRLGDGEQWIPWIHYEDEIGAIHFLMKNEEAEGPFNLTAPNPVRNKQFTEQLASALNRPAPFAVPEFVLNLVLGDMASAVLEGQRVIPARLQEAGYQFKYPHLADALSSLAKEL